MFPALALAPPVVVTPAVTTFPPVEVVAPMVVVPPGTLIPPVADVPPEPATPESDRLTASWLLEQFPTVAATNNRPKTRGTRRQREKVADGVFGLEFGMGRVLLRNQSSPVQGR
jgi:hypothetical protein